MDNEVLLKSALFYHNEGLCVIPIVYGQKNPAIDWTEYQTRCSTLDEVKRWYGNCQPYNIGIVHGQVSDNFVSIDIDHDNGVTERIKAQFPELFTGRIEQSGSGKGYHIPLRLVELPLFGDDRHGKPRGNRTWKMDGGMVNIRARDCQTVVPPSLHPSGNRYRFIQKGNITRLPDLTGLVAWLDQNQTKPEHRTLSPLADRSIQPPAADSLLAAVKAAWPDTMAVFKEFGLDSKVEYEENDELRLLGHGGLLVTEDKQKWYCFTDEVGGGPIEAWGWCKFGTGYSKSRFREVLLDMARVAGIDTARFYRSGDETITPTVTAPDNCYWTRQYEGYWEKLR